MLKLYRNIFDVMYLKHDIGLRLGTLTEKERVRRSARRFFLNTDSHLWANYLLIVKNIIGLDAGWHCAALSSNTTYPGYDYVRYHRDYPYTQSSSDKCPIELNKYDLISLSTILSLDSVSEENGTKICLGTETENYDMTYAPFTPIVVPMSPGDLLVFDARLVHAAAPNNTSDPRTLILAQFVKNYIPLMAVPQTILE